MSEYLQKGELVSRGGSSEAKPISALAGLSLEQQLAKIEGAPAAAAGGGSQPDKRPDPGQLLFFSRSEGVRPPQVLPFGFGWPAWAHQISDWAIVQQPRRAWLMGDVTKAEMHVDCFVLPAAAGCGDGISQAAAEEGAPEGCEAVSWRSSCLTGPACC